MRIVFIAGAGRSGSTLFAQCLQQATGATHLGEVRYVWSRGLRENQLCECGETFEDCHFWTAVMRQAFGDAVHVDSAAERLARRSVVVDRMRYVPRNSLPAAVQRAQGQVSEWGDILHSLYSAASSVSGSEILIDSSKDPSYLFALKATGRFAIDTVHLVRDPRGVAYSWTRSRVRPEIHWEKRYMNVRSPRASAVRWLSANAAAAFYRQGDPRATLVRYEDFCASPDRVLRDLRAKLALVQGVEGETGHGFSGNPSRFDRTQRRIVCDESWRLGLPTADRRLVSAISAPLRWRYGYR
jgi:hypothetical protein